LAIFAYAIEALFENPKCTLKGMIFIFKDRNERFPKEWGEGI